MRENNSNDVENNDRESEEKNCNNMLTNNINEDYPIDNSQQDLFSDEEETNQENERTLQQIPDDCSFLNSFKTPVIVSDVEENGSNSPVIPKTPASLAPFIYKINEPWTSELETPEAKLATKLQNSSIDKAAKQHQTPVLEKIRLENDASPVLSNNKRRKPKRQIFKANALENLEITPSFENILQNEESKINSEIVKEGELIASTVQEEVSNNSTDLENSNPKRDDSEIKVDSTATSSTSNLLIDKYREVKNFLEGQENYEIPKIDLPESDMLKSVIHLERASADFCRPPNITTPIISEMELVPFSQFFKNSNESFTEIKDDPKINERIEETKVLKENHCQEENRMCTTKSPHSKQVKIFKDNNLEEKVPLTEEESEIFDLSQWVYTGKSLNESTTTNKENETSKHFEKEPIKEEIDQKSENFKEKTEFDEMFQDWDSLDFEPNFREKITPEDLKKDLKETKFTPLLAGGFSTAGGKSIKIDKDKLAKAEKMYQETENTENFESKQKSDKFSKTNKISNLKEENFDSPDFSVGFSTAGGRSIKIDKDKLAKAEKMYQEIENDENCESKLKSDIVSKTFTDKNNSLPNLKADKLSMIADKNNSLPNLKIGETFESPNFSLGFSTAGGRSIKIDKDKLAKAEKMYQETENTENFESKQKSDKFLKTNKISNLKEENFDSPDFSVGFSTAGGRSIKIDKDKLAKAEKMYQETEDNENCESKQKSDKISLPKEENSQSSNISTGFSTAGGRSIKIDKDKLARAEKLYQEVETKVNETFREEESPIASTSKENHPPQLKTNYTSGFATAGGKNIAISQEKLSRAQKIYNEIEISATDKETIGKENEFFPNESNKTPKTYLPNSQNKSENTMDLRRKVIDRNINNSKQFKPLQIGIPRNSPLCSRNLTKSATKGENTDLKSRDCKNSIQEKLFENEFEDTRKNCSLPVISENKQNLQINQRLSQSTPVRSKKSPPLNQQIASLSEHLLPESSVQDLSSEKNSSTITNLNSSPFSGFTLTESLSSTLFYSKFVDLLEKVNNLEKNISPILENFSKTEEQRDIRSQKNSQVESKMSMELSVSNSSQEKANLNLNLQNLSNKTEDKVSNRRLQWNNVMKRSIDEVDDNTPLGRYDNSKKPKLNNDLMVKKLFIEGAISDDETESPANVNSLNQSGTSSSNSNQTKESHDYSSSILTDTVVSEEFFKPFMNEGKETEEEKNKVPEEMPKSPVLGKSKFKKRRKLRATQMEKFDSLLSDGSSNLQSSGSNSLLSDSDVLEKLISAAFELDKMISRKRKEKPRPMRGSFLANREENKSSRISLFKLANGCAPTLRNEQELKERGINPDVLNVTASTAELYKFKMDTNDELDRRNLVSLKVGDGATLVLDKNFSAGVEEFERAFEASPGVDPTLLPRGWLINHYRWIVWKLASLDRIKLGSSDTQKLLTPDRVMKDLKYRYDREIDRSQRSVIRKILEKDEVPSKKMVLCIASITESVENEIEEKDPRILLRTPRWKIEVTDGWYSIPVSFDTAMMKNIVDGKIQEGTKIVTYGAELLNCDQGCYPLEKLENVCLKIHTNSTRRARWDVKLGLQKISGPINSSLKAVDPNGGFIGQVNVIISRIYPIMYREKTSDGQTIYRNEKQEEKAATDYNHEREKKAELLYAKAQEKLEGNKHDSSEEDSGGSLAHFDSFNNLTEAQRNKLFVNRQAKMEKLKMEINEEVKSSYPPRNVVPVRKIRIIDGESCAILTIWSSNDDVSIFKEGNSYSICNINAYGRRDGELHLTASRQAIFKSVANSSQIYPRRQFTSLSEISLPGFEPPYQELDTIGVVSWIGNTPHGMKNFEAICISSPNEESSSTYLLIMFWQGISSYGFSNILTVGSLIACSNLEIRKTRSASNISLCYCSERTVFTKSPRQAHLLSAFEALNKQITDVKSYAKSCGEEISCLLHKKPISRLSGQGIMDSVERNSGNGSPHFMVAKTPMDVDTPIKSSAIKKRFARLSRYAEPPELSPMVLNNSRNIHSSFRPVIMTPTSTKLTNTRPDTT